MYADHKNFGFFLYLVVFFLGNWKISFNLILLVAQKQNAFNNLSPSRNALLVISKLLKHTIKKKKT